MLNELFLALYYAAALGSDRFQEREVAQAWLEARIDNEAVFSIIIETKFSDNCEARARASRLENIINERIKNQREVIRRLGWAWYDESRDRNDYERGIDCPQDD